MASYKVRLHIWLALQICILVVMAHNDWLIGLLGAASAFLTYWFFSKERNLQPKLTKRQNVIGVALGLLIIAAICVLAIYGLLDILHGYFVVFAAVVLLGAYIKMLIKPLTDGVET